MMPTAAKPPIKSRGLIFKPAMIRSFLRKDNPKAQTRRPIFKDNQPGNHMVWRCYDQKTKAHHWQDGDDRLRCPWVAGMHVYAKETFWAKHDTDCDDYSTWSCGPCLDLGPEFHPGIQYCATPEGENPPFFVQSKRNAGPGEWWEGPPDDWDGMSDYHGRGTWEFHEWADGFFSKCSSMFMPKWVARIHRVITEVRAERVNQITGADAIAEGLSTLSKDDGQTWKWGIPDRDGLPGNDNDGWSWKDWEVDPRMAYRRLWDSIYGAGAFDRGDWCWVLDLAEIMPDGGND